ncbi:leucyl aminopeptidase [Oceanivirga miroungae]|uniref:Probable cytosol aminopeptidase n=1 Tax=Oceanivirga miroungae TaxID=1130046 RepID=A0A6I8M867_9FUSO|nr:leucyl aminopeptidase [Oceanivirga miroungae]VWL85630.1 Cytosol aminopeptidase [Oceanivirga miroungae]
MKFNFNNEKGLLVHLMFEDSALKCDVFSKLVEKKIFSKKSGEIYLDIYNGACFVGLGKKEELEVDNLREIFFKLANELKAKKVEEVQIELPKLENICEEGIVTGITEGFIQSEYDFNRFKSDKNDKYELVVNLNKATEKQIKEVEDLENLMSAVFETRDLVNLPSNYIYPETLAKNAQELLSPLGVKVSIYGKEEIKKMGMEAFYAVGKGSDNEPRLIVMEYDNNSDSNEKIALVGKGITYDAGGYSLKPSDSMKTMFCDMGGAASVIGTILALAKNKVKTNVVGVVAACENAVSGHSYKPGDIIGSLSGKTIEVDNTDAEGRVTLADSVYYATKFKNATKVIDLATLTGACLVALGEVYTGALTNNQEFYNNLLEASYKAGEKIWQLPYDKEFKKLNKSHVADIKNSGGRLGGTITAGLFISEFINDLPWVHLDIAGTAFLSSANSYLPKGATGVHVKTLYYLLKEDK